MRRVTALIALVLGVLLIAGAGVVKWVAAPAMIKLPGDTTITRIYTGTAKAVFNPTATTGTLFGPAVLTNQPATVKHTVTISDTTANNAFVADRRTVSIPGHAVADVTDKFAVDRKNLGHGTGFSGVVNQTGLTFNWPIGTKKQDYVGWQEDTFTTTTLHYTGTAKRGGVNTYVYTASVPSRKIVNPGLLAQLPKSMSKATLESMVGTMGLTTAQLTDMAKVLGQLPDPVPFAYTFTGSSTYWIAPDSGVVVDLQSHEVRTANFVLNGTLIPVGPVLDLSFTSPPSTLKAAADDAKDKASQMTLIRTTLPLAALILGVVLVLVGATLLLVRRRRPPMAPPAPARPERELTPVG